MIFVNIRNRTKQKLQIINLLLSLNLIIINDNKKKAISYSINYSLAYIDAFMMVYLINI